MCVMKRNGEEGLLIIDKYLRLQFYSHLNDQWSEITNAVEPEGNYERWLHNVLVFPKGNSMFVLNMSVPIMDEDEPEGEEYRQVSWKLTIPEDGREVNKEEIEGLPVLNEGAFLDLFGAVLAIPTQK